MSRKTRKLIWSAPLVAVLAVAGALAMFAALGPGSASANPLPDAPSNLVVTPATGNDGKDGRTMLVLNWDAPAGGNVTGYRIDRSTRGFIWETLEMDTGNTMTTYTDDDRNAGETRWYRVFALNEHSADLGPSPVSNPKSGKTTAKGKPSVPLSFTGAVSGRDQINLSWNPPADDGGVDITGYEIQYHDGSTWVVLPGVSDDGQNTELGFVDADDGTSHQDEHELDAGEERTYRIRAYNAAHATATADDMSDWTPERPFLLRSSAAAANPDPVRGLTAVSDGGGSIQLYWFAPENNGGFAISHYLVQVRRAQTDWPDIPDDDELAALSIENKTGGEITAEGGTFRILAVAANGVVQKSFASIPVTWDDNGDEEDAAQVDAADRTPKVALRLQFRVFAETTDDGPNDAEDPNDDELRRSRSSNYTHALQASGRPTPDTLAPPTTFETNAPSGSDHADAKEQEIDVEISYATDVDDPNNFRIDYSADNGNTWKSLVPTTLFTLFGDDDRVYTDDDGLGYDEQRDYRIFVVGGDWLTDVGPAPAMMATGYTDESGDPGKVTGVTASSPNLMTIDASWAAPSDTGGQPVVYYEYQYVEDDGDGVYEPGAAANEDWNGSNNPTMAASTMSADTMKSIELGTDLVKESLYYIRVRAVNRTAGIATNDPRMGPWSDGAPFTTGEPTAPGVVEGLTSEIATDSSGNTRGVNLLWNKPSGDVEATQYDIQRKIGDGEWIIPEDGENRRANRTNYTDPRHYVAGEQLTYQVRAKNEAGESNWTMVYYLRDPAADHTHVATKPTNGDGIL